MSCGKGLTVQLVELRNSELIGIAGELASLLQQIFSSHSSSDYYAETIWHSEQELEKLLLTGHKLSAPATRHVQKEDDEEYEQFHGFELGM